MDFSKQERLPKVEIKKLEINGEVIKENWPCYFDEDSQRDVWTYSPSGLLNPISSMVYTDDISPAILKVAIKNGNEFEGAILKYLVEKNYGLVNMLGSNPKIRSKIKRGIDQIYSKSNKGKAIPQLIKHNGISWKWVFIEKLKLYRLIACEFDFEFNKFFIECKQSSDYQEKINILQARMEKLKPSETMARDLLDIQEQIKFFNEKKRLIEIMFELQMEIQKKVGGKEVKLLWVSNENATFKDHKSNKRLDELFELLVYIKFNGLSQEKGQQLVAQELREKWELSLPQIGIGGII